MRFADISEFTLRENQTIRQSDVPKKCTLGVRRTKYPNASEISDVSTEAFFLMGCVLINKQSDDKSKSQLRVELDALPQRVAEL